MKHGENLGFGRKSLETRRLIAEFKRGDSQAFATIYNNYRAPLIAFVSSRGGGACESSAEEIVQETFLRAFRFRESYLDDFELSTWLFSIARNVTADSLSRARSVEGPIYFDGDFDADRSIHPAPSAEERLEWSMRLHRLLRYFKALPSGQRRALFLRLVRKLSYEEIAIRMKLSLSAVRSALSRARGSLSLEWRRSELDPPEPRVCPPCSRAIIS